MLENKQMLNDLLDTPERFLHHIRRYSNALTTSMVFGWRTPMYEDDAMKQLFDGFSEFSDINQTGTAALIDFFPVLRQLPDFILSTQKKAKDLHKRERELYLRHWLRAKNEWKDSSIRHCFCVGMAEAQEKEQFSDPQAVCSSRAIRVMAETADIQSRRTSRELCLKQDRIRPRAPCMLSSKSVSTRGRPSDEI